MFMGEADLNPAVQSDSFVPEPYRAVRVTRELHDTVTVELAPVSGKRPSFEPGQFNMLYAFGVGEAAISISGDPSEEGTFVHTIRNVGAISKALSAFEAGSVAGLRGPFGTGWPVNAAVGSDVVLVAGGLGLAPLRPAIYHLLANRGQYGRISILYGCRNPADILYRHELEEWRQRLDLDLTVTVDHADTDWHGSVGVVPALIRRAAFDPHDTVAMVCGPEIMMRYSVNALRSAGIGEKRIYLSVERNMKCGIGLCGHCQFGPDFVCKDGPVVPYSKVSRIFAIREI
jgi:NAD(P)H-flavin reductase